MLCCSRGFEIIFCGFGRSLRNVRKEQFGLELVHTCLMNGSQFSIFTENAGLTRPWLKADAWWVGYVPYIKTARRGAAGHLPSVHINLSFMNIQALSLILPSDHLSEVT